MGRYKHDFNSFGFRFHLKKSGSEYYITVGINEFDGANFRQYIRLDRTAFADYAPVSEFIYTDPIQAMIELGAIKQWCRELCKSRPKSKEFLKKGPNNI